VFDRIAIERAVDLQQRSYKLLRWMTDAIERGFISYDAVHDFASLPAATFAWIDRHHADLPPAARPSRDELRPFCNLFATYVETSFELLEHPGHRPYSPGDHCFCPACSWLVPIPRLRLKKLAPQDHRRARALQVSALKQLALEIDRTLTDEAAARLLGERRHHEAAGLVAYGHDLARRIDGVTCTPATLVLWRTFAWNEAGAPKPGFVLSAELILGAEAQIIATLGS
jgi:hypothetical protein